MQSDMFEAMEEAERFLPHIFIATLVIITVAAVIALASPVLILGLFAIMAATAGFVWLNLKSWPLD